MTTTRPHHRRDGLVLLLLLLLLPGLFLFVVLVLSVDRGRRDTAELRNAAMAASLAAAEELASDDLLTADPTRLNPLLAAARASAKNIALLNTAGGKPVSLADADVVFGHSTQGFGGLFTPLDPTGSNPDWTTVNAVQVTARLAANADKATRVTAMFDTAVTGFRPTMTRFVPMAPFALYDGDAPTDSNAPPVIGWSNALAGKMDLYQYNPATGPATGGDGLREVVVVIGSPPATAPPAVPTFVLNLGATNSLNTTLAQIGRGIQPADLSDSAFGGEFSLLPDMVKPVVGTTNALNSRLGDAATAFGQIVGQKRVWPLFVKVDNDGHPIVNGFVAARLLKVDYASGAPAVRLTLQEAVLATPTAVTAPKAAATPTRKSVGKVRLAG